MKNSGIRNFLIIIGLGVLIAAALLYSGKDPSSSTELSQPQSGDSTNANVVQPADLPKQDSIPSADDAIMRPDLEETSPTVDPESTEHDEASLNEKKIYTMDTLPQGKPGIYWVKDSEGNEIQVAVDVPVPDSPVGDVGEGSVPAE